MQPFRGQEPHIWPALARMNGNSPPSLLQCLSVCPTGGRGSLFALVQLDFSNGETRLQQDSEEQWAVGGPQHD